MGGCSVVSDARLAKVWLETCRRMAETSLVPGSSASPGRRSTLLPSSCAARTGFALSMTSSGQMGAHSLSYSCQFTRRVHDFAIYVKVACSSRVATTFDGSHRRHASPASAQLIRLVQTMPHELPRRWDRGAMGTNPRHPDQARKIWGQIKRRTPSARCGVL